MREEELEDLSEQRAREVLDTAVEKVRSAGTTVAQTHLREGCRTRSSPWPRTWGSGGRGREQGSGRDKEGLDGQRLGRRGEARLLPSLGGAPVRIGDIGSPTVAQVFRADRRWPIHMRRTSRHPPGASPSQERGLCSQRLPASPGQSLSADRCCGLRRGRIAVVVVDYLPEVGLEQNVRVELRGASYLLRA